MKNIFLGSLLAAALFAYSSCDCPPMFTLEEESLQSPFQVVEFYVDGGVYFRFNKPVDTTSLIALQTLLIGGGNTKYTGYFELSPDQLQVSIPQCEIFCNAPQSTCPFTLRLDGDMVDGMAVRSAGGQILDGDLNGSDGGDFSRAIGENGLFDCGLYTLTVTEPSNGSSASFPSTSFQNVLIDITFSANMDTGSVKAGKNVYLQCQSNPAVKRSGSIFWFSRTQLRFISKETVTELKSFCPAPNGPTIYKFIMEGIGNDPVKSVYGIPVENGGQYDFTIFL